MSGFLMVDRRILPDYYDKVIEARHKLAAGLAKDVSQAAKMVGISRSTYYKYKDYVFEPSELSASGKAVFSVMLQHESGVLSSLLAQVSNAGGSILTITQSIPVRALASVTVSMDIDHLKEPIVELMKRIEQCPGVERLTLLAVE